MFTLTQPGSQQLVTFRTDAGKLSWFVHTLVLAQIVGVAALINVCRITRVEILLTSHHFNKKMEITDNEETVSYHYRQSHQAPVHNPGHSDKGRYRRCCNTSENRGRPCHIHSHLKDISGFQCDTLAVS